VVSPEAHENAEIIWTVSCGMLCALVVAFAMSTGLLKRRWSGGSRPVEHSTMRTEAD
jgi:hypothetical protein